MHARGPVAALALALTLSLSATGGRSLAAPVPVGFIGDSITHAAWLPERTPELAGRLLDRPVVDRGISATTTADWLPGARTGYLRAAIAAFLTAHASVVQVALGTNDAWHLHAAPPVYRARLATICAALSAAGLRPVLAMPPALIAGGANGTVTAPDVRRLASYDAAIRDLAGSQGILLGETDAPAYFAAHPAQLLDGVHPGPAGSMALAGMWAAGIVPALH